VTDNMIVKLIIGACALALLAGTAHAGTTYTLSLTGDATDVTTDFVPYPGGRIDEISTYPLAFAPGRALPTVSDGDTVDVTVNMSNGPIAVAPSNAYNGISVGFLADIAGTSTPVGPSDTTVGSMLSASSMGTTTIPLSSSGETTAETIISNGLVEFPPSDGFSFDEVFSHMVITDNGASGQPADLISAYLETDRVNGVPEPTTWGLLALGFAGLGFAGYRRSRKAVSIAA
jgi:PEP-CTERM motif